jgi:hypothetical protein
MRFSEKPDNVALYDRVAFLHLRAAFFQRIVIMLPGRACSPATAVTPCIAADQHDHIARMHLFPDNA